MTTSLRTAALLAVLALGCKDRQQATPGAPPAEAPGRVDSTAARAKRSDTPDCDAPVIRWRFPAPGKIVAIGDVHGDLPALERTLRAAGVLGADRTWSGGTAVLVQTGDILDRGDDEPEIYELFDRLAGEAAAAGGRVVLLHGNHELMNAAGDLRYVTPGGFADFADTEISPELAKKLSGIEPGYRGRLAAWLPGGPWARRIADHPIVAVVGKSVFAHGGVHREFVAEVDLAHRRTQCWLRGQSDREPRDILAGVASPVWTRAYASPRPPCAELSDVLTALDAERLVIGHTTQRAITSACGERVWLIDTGMAAHYGGTAAALIIEGSQARAVVAGKAQR